MGINSISPDFRAYRPSYAMRRDKCIYRQDDAARGTGTDAFNYPIIWIFVIFAL